MQQLFESWLSQDITYQHMKNNSLFCQYIASTITYQTQFALKQKSLEALENDLMILIKILEEASQMFDVKDLTFTYPKNKEATIKGISFNIKKGEIFGF